MTVRLKLWHRSSRRGDRHTVDCNDLEPSTLLTYDINNLVGDLLLGAAAVVDPTRGGTTDCDAHDCFDHELRWYRLQTDCHDLHVYAVFLAIVTFMPRLPPLVLLHAFSSHFPHSYYHVLSLDIGSADLSSMFSAPGWAHQRCSTMIFGGERAWRIHRCQWS